MSSLHTPAQQIAIESDDPTILVEAGPGAGKSRTLAHRIARLVSSGAKLEEMAVMSFTNAAANEIEEKIGKAIPSECAQNLLGFCGTLHAFALRILKEFGAGFGYGDRTTVISPESAIDLLESKAKTLGCHASTKDLLEIKHAGRPKRGKKLSLAETVVASYFDEMKESAIVDYDVLLSELAAMLDDTYSPAELWGSSAGTVRDAIAARFTHLFVDEVQDSAPIDWAIYRALPIQHKFLVGDPDQAIYSFRGGRVAEMLEEAQRPTTLVVRLEENFRSCKVICSAAQRLIEGNKQRAPKKTFPCDLALRFPGVVEDLGEFDSPAVEIASVASKIRRLTRPEMGDVALKGSDIVGTSIAILTRTNAIAAGFRTLLPSMGVPVKEFKRSELPVDWPLARATAELLIDPDNDSLAFLYLVARFEIGGASPKEAREAAHAALNAARAAGKPLNRANIGLHRVTMASSIIEALQGAKISREAKAIALDKYRKLPLGSTPLDYVLALGEVREYEQEGENDGVTILTIHGAKGREFDIVFVAGFEEEAIPGRAVKDGPEALEEERRLAYVAVTRARNELYFSRSRTRTTQWGAVQERHASRFLAEIVGPPI